MGIVCKTHFAMYIAIYGIMVSSIMIQYSLKWLNNTLKS